MVFNLNPIQIEIIRHRLEVPCSIVDAIEEFHEDDIRDVCAALLSGLGPLGLNMVGAEEISEMATRYILAECIEGSTYLAGIRDECNSAAAARVIRSFRKLKRLIESYCGRKLSEPNF
jgi:hypothetical protein